MLFRGFALAAILSAAVAVPIDEASDAPLRFDGHPVLRFTPENDDQLESLRNLHQQSWKLGLDFWTEPSRVGKEVDIRIPPFIRDQVDEVLAGVPVKTFVADVQASAERCLANRNNASATYFENYHTADEIDSFVNNLVAAHSKVASIIKVGTTYEGNSMNLVKIHNGDNLPTIWLDGGIHSREWISPATVTYVLNDILTSTDPKVRAAVDSVNWYILPLFNVDGYKYTWAKDRMWRKTRSKNHLSLCVGTDPNRNWDFHWCEAGASKEPCSDSYCGKEAFSEVEVKSVADFIQKDKSIHGYVNFHSYSQLWMEPWGYTETEDTDVDYKAQDKLASDATTALQAVHGTHFDYGPIAKVIYPASGSSADWTYGTSSVKFSYGVELRDTGEHGFLLPPEQIIPSGEETMAAVIAMTQTVKADWDSKH